MYNLSAILSVLIVALFSAKCLAQDYVDIQTENRWLAENSDKCQHPEKYHGITVQEVLDSCNIASKILDLKKQRNEIRQQEAVMKMLGIK